MTTTMYLAAVCAFLAGGLMLATREPSAVMPSAGLMALLPGVALAHLLRAQWREVSWTPFVLNVMTIYIMLVWVWAAWAFVHAVNKANAQRRAQTT